MKHANRGPSGFTLIEVLVAVAILGLIGAALGQSAWMVTRGRRSVETRQLMYHKARVALHKLRVDLSMAFIAKPILSTTGQDVSPWRTGFVGEEHSVQLTTLSGRRLVAGAVAADMREVGYELAALAAPDEREDPQANYGGDAQQLMRREDPLLDDRVEEGGETQLLLEGATALTFEYYDFKKGEWNSEWDSTSAIHVNQLPRAVRVTLGLAHPLDPDKTLTFQTVALIGLGPDPVEVP